MQTSKFLFVIGAAAILAAPLQVTAGPDSEAQAKMREAMRQKMEELNAQSAPAPAPVAPSAEVLKPVEPKPAPLPVVKAPTVVVPVPAEPVAVPTPVAPAKAAGTDARFSEPADPNADAQAARLQEALRQKIAAEKAAAPAVTSAAAPAAPAKPVAVVRAPAPGAAVVITQPAVTLIETAPSPLSGSKQQRLAALLQLYKSDQITPQQYHTQRATIIAEP